MLKRFISYYKPHVRLFTLDMLASLVISLTGIIYPIITRRMLNDLIPNREYRLIVIFGIGLLAVYLVRMGLNYFVQYYGHVMGVKMQAQMRSDMFRRLEELPYSFYDSHRDRKNHVENDERPDGHQQSCAHHGPGKPASFPESRSSPRSVYLIKHKRAADPHRLRLRAAPRQSSRACRCRVKMRDAFKKSRESRSPMINAALESSYLRHPRHQSLHQFRKGNRKNSRSETESSSSSRSADSYKAMGHVPLRNQRSSPIYSTSSCSSRADCFSIHEQNLVRRLLRRSLCLSASSSTPVMTLINFMEQYQNGVTGLREVRGDNGREARGKGQTTDAKDAGKRLRGTSPCSHVSYSYDGAKEVLRST